MKVCYGNDCRQPILATDSSVVTIGMFDGVHLGHQKVIEETIRLSRELNAPAIALTFDIHPRTFLSSAPDMICSLNHRVRLLESLGLDAVWVLSFNQELARISASEFARRYLHDTLHANCLLMGETGSFGYKGEGTIRYVLDNQLLPDARIVPAVTVNGEKVSSTVVREAVQSGRLDTAREILGRPVSVMGTVTRGKQIGRTIGFPTLNIDPHHELHPPKGVYATLARCGNTTWQSITNIGNRPTIEKINEDDLLVETHLFDYSGNLYSQTVEVCFLKKIREEIRFESLEKLCQQIKIDTVQAKKFIAKFLQSE